MGTTPKKPRSDMSAGLSECLMALALSCDRTAKLAAAAWEALTPLGMREHLRNCRAEQRHAQELATACETLLSHQVQERMRAP